MVCKECNHTHCFDDFCGVVLSANEEAGVILADCACYAKQIMEKEN